MIYPAIDLRTVALFIIVAVAIGAAVYSSERAPVPPAPADGASLIIHGAPVWSAGLQHEQADAVAVAGERIVAVGPADEVLAHRGQETRVIELAGGRIVPGFIDNHTHFNRAGELLLGINLLDVADAETLAERVVAARDRLPQGSWITGGQWGAYEAWGMGTSGAAEPDDPVEPEPFHPDRTLIDELTPDVPVLLWNWDGSRWLANTAAIEQTGVECDWPDVECRDGTPTGRMGAESGQRMRQQIPPPSFEQRLAEARLALARLRSHGVTGIHDITPPQQIKVFQYLHRRGELTTRIYARPTLDKWQELAAVGIEHGFGDEYLKIGGLKGFVDGIMGNSSARFHEPYEHTGERGGWRQMMQPPEKMQQMLIGADAAGHWPQVHAIGDEAVDTLLDMFQNVIDVNGPAERRLRMIHAQVLAGPEVAQRMADMGLIAEMQPYHAIDDMRWMEERIGARARWAYAFATLHEAGVMLSFGSDWPGTNAAWYPSDPLAGIYAAVVRKTLDGKPEQGWYPEERIDVQTALEAYTINNAYAAGEENLKGRLAPGLLADIVVLDADPFAVPPEQIKDIEVLYTIVGGEVVYTAPGAD
ncbi:MAG: amidohydrolase [Wenzhouxiangellaceae bacterium]